MMIRKLFGIKEDQNEKLLKNIKRYEQKKKIKQQKPKILGQKLVKGKADKN